MAVPANPRLSDVCAEFLAPATTPLSAFVRGGAWVPNTAANSGVPTALPISLSQLAGAVRYIPMVVSAGNVTGDSWPGSNIVFGSSAASVSGGTAPYTILWTQVSGATFTIDSPTSATTNFRRPGNPPQGVSATGTYRVTYTDATSATAFKDITVTDTRS